MKQCGSGAQRFDCRRAAKKQVKVSNPEMGPSIMICCVQSGETSSRTPISETNFFARQGVISAWNKKTRRACLGRLFPNGVSGAEWAIRLTAFLAFAGYVLALASCRGRVRGAGPSASGWWSLGLAAFLAHLACAFHFEHGWSHASALAATASQTKEATGFDTGFGLYLNYAFALAWLADTVWWRLAKRSHESRPTWVGVALHCFMAFMWFNAMVVFGSPWGQATGWAAIVGLGGWFVLQRRQAI